MGRLRSFLFPDPPRAFRWRRWIKIGLRAIHALCASVLVGGALLAVDPSQSSAWAAGTAISGLALVLLDLHESGAFLVQIRGLVVFAKIALLATLPWLGWAPTLLATALVLSVLSSHAPGSVRYFMVLGRGRITGGCSKG